MRSTGYIGSGLAQYGSDGRGVSSFQAVGLSPRQCARYPRLSSQATSEADP